jgi:putative endopeptidase
MTQKRTLVLSTRPRFESVRIPRAQHTRVDERNHASQRSSTHPHTGGIGVVMGHELSHGFDDQGRLYDGTGKLTNWWQNATATAFEARATCLVNQYSNFEILPGVHVNGNLTLGENIADNGGVKTAFHAFQRHMRRHTLAAPHTRSRTLPRLTNEQVFFVSYAQLWCAKATDDFARLRVKTDVHSPPRFRIIGPLQNSDAFATAFQCRCAAL